MEGKGTLAYIVPVNSGDEPGGGYPSHPIVIPGHPSHPIAGQPGSPEHPIVLPPLPPGFYPSHPIVLPPSGGIPTQPIYYPEEPEHPITLPPATVWPPLNPSDGVVGKSLLLVLVVGASGGQYRWILSDQEPVGVWRPPVPEPK